MQSSLLSLDHFTQQQDYQRSLLINNSSSSSSKHKKHSRKHRHKHSDKCRGDKCGHRHHRHGHSHSHRSKKSRKDYGSVNDQCAVCLDDEHELDTRLFPCKHVFHGECLIELSVSKCICISLYISHPFQNYLLKRDLDILFCIDKCLVT